MILKMFLCKHIVLITEVLKCYFLFLTMTLMVAFTAYLLRACTWLHLLQDIYAGATPWGGVFMIMYMKLIGYICDTHDWPSIYIN